MDSISATDKDKQPATSERYDELTDPGYDDDEDDQHVTLDELYDAIAELRGVVMALAQPCDSAVVGQGCRTGQARGRVRRRARVPQYGAGLLQAAGAQRACCVANACAPARQMVIDAMGGHASSCDAC
jgi:hypothetical protein